MSKIYRHQKINYFAQKLMWFFLETGLYECMCKDWHYTWFGNDISNSIDCPLGLPHKLGNKFYITSGESGRQTFESLRLHSDEWMLYSLLFGTGKIIGWIYVILLNATQNGTFLSN